MRMIARIAVGCRAARADEDRRASPARGRQQVTIGQIMFLVALWAIAAAALRMPW
jgi:hypothetical protein